MKRLRKTKKGVFNQISSLLIALAGAAIISVVMFLILAQGQDQIVDIQGIDETNTSTYTTAYNATTTLTTAASDIPEWFPIIVIVAIGILIFGLVKTFKHN